MGARFTRRPGARSWVAGLALLGLVAQVAAGFTVVGVTAAVPAQAATALLTEVGAPFSRMPLLPPGQPLLTFSAGEFWSSAAVGDVTGDRSPDIVVGGGLSSYLWVYSISGGLIAQINVGGVNTAVRSGGIQASPALSDVNLDGVLDVTIATTSNLVASYSFRGGVASRLIWRQDAPLVPGGPNGMIATPAIGFVNTDARPDVVTASWGQALDAYSGMGGRIPGWPKWLRDSIWSSPAIGDVDGDGANDVVVGADCEGNNIGTQPCGTVSGGYVWAFNKNGTEKWRYFLRGQVVWSSPALADLNGDGAQDVVVGSGGYWDEPAGRVVTALNGRTGAVLWTAGTPLRVVGSPSLADVTGDGVPDAFVVTHGGYMMAFNGKNGAPLWGARCITDSGVCGKPKSGTKSGVALADIDGDGRIEAVTQGEQQLRVYDAASGTLEWAHKSSYTGTILAPANTPTIADVGGQAWIVQPVRGISASGVNELVVTVWRTGKALGAAPWPTFKANNQRTGAASSAADISKIQAFVRTMYRDFLGRQASPAELASWTSRLAQRQLSRYEMANELARSNEWITSVITKFYLDTLRRPPDPVGLAGWIKAARSGMPVAQIASAFYASPEYYSSVGRGDPATWVRDLYVKLLGRPADAGGLAGWVAALRAGMPRDQLALGFYQSPESLGVRVNALYVDLLGRPAEPGTSASWIPFVKSQGDLVLAAALAASGEYFVKAVY